MRTKPAQSRHYAHRSGANQLPKARLELDYVDRLVRRARVPDESAEAILARAKRRGQAMHLPYAGALLPAEAHALMQQVPAARLIDVRTRAEWDYVGHVPESVLIEWNTYPSGQRNQAFLEELQARIAKSDAPVMFLCRSGVRSHHAAQAATQAGYPDSYNILEGFEGDKDANGHRNTVGGWRFAGLPWVQG